MKTPKSTIGRHEGMIQVSPRYLSNVLRRSDSPRSQESELQQRKTSGSYVTNDTAAALSRMLTNRASNLGSDSGEQSINPDTTPRQSGQRRKYVFDDELTPKPATRTYSPSALGRSDTVIRTRPFSTPIELGPMEASHLQTLEATRPSPALAASHKPSLNDEAANGALDATTHRAIQNDAAMSMEPPAPRLRVQSLREPRTDKSPSDVYDTRIRPASEYWLRGASRLLSRSSHGHMISGDHEISNGGERHYDSGFDDGDFGGVDGEDDSPPDTEFYNARSRIQTEGSEGFAVPHMYNRHVPVRLASRSHLGASMLPQLNRSIRKRSFGSQESERFSVNKHHETSSSDILPNSSNESSSGLHTLDVPMAWHNKGSLAGSSV